MDENGLGVVACKSATNGSAPLDSHAHRLKPFATSLTLWSKDDVMPLRMGADLVSRQLDQKVREAPWQWRFAHVAVT